MQNILQVVNIIAVYFLNVMFLCIYTYQGGEMKIRESNHFTIQYKIKDYTIDFQVFEPIEWLEDPITREHTIRAYEKIGAIISMDTTESLDEAKKVLEGTLKWDGCMNVNYYPDIDGMVHHCGLSNALLISEIMKEIYKIGPELKTWDVGCAV